MYVFSFYMSHRTNSTHHCYCARSLGALSPAPDALCCKRISFPTEFYFHNLRNTFGCRFLSYTAFHIFGNNRCRQFCELVPFAFVFHVLSRFLERVPCDSLGNTKHCALLQKSAHNLHILALLCFRFDIYPFCIFRNKTV